MAKTKTEEKVKFEILYHNLNELEKFLKFAKNGLDEATFEIKDNKLICEAIDKAVLHYIGFEMDIDTNTKTKFALPIENFLRAIKGTYLTTFEIDKSNVIVKSDYTKYILKQIEVQEQLEININELQYDFEINNVDLSEIKNNNWISDEFTLEIKNNKLILRIENDLIKFEKVLKENLSLTNKNIKAKYPIQLIQKLPTLKDLTISFKNDYPLKIVSKLTYSKITLIVAPRVDE